MQKDSNKDALSKALVAWRDVDTSPGFEDRVRRRIEASNARPARSPWLEWIVETVSDEPVWLPAIAAVAGVILGAFVVLPSLPSKSSMPGNLQVMRVGTLSGDYVRLVTGGTR